MLNWANAPAGSVEWVGIAAKAAPVVVSVPPPAGLTWQVPQACPVADAYAGRAEVGLGQSSIAAPTTRQNSIKNNQVRFETRSANLPSLDSGDRSESRTPGRDGESILLRYLLVAGSCGIHQPGPRCPAASFHGNSGHNRGQCRGLRRGEAGVQCTRKWMTNVPATQTRFRMRRTWQTALDVIDDKSGAGGSQPAILGIHPRRGALRRRQRLLLGSPV